MSNVKFVAEIAGQKILVITNKYRLTARGDKRPAELKVCVSAKDVAPLPMNEAAKTLVFEDRSCYGFEAIEGLFEKDIVRFADKNGEIHTGEVIRDFENGLHCLKTPDGAKYPFYRTFDRLVVGSALLGDKAEQFETGYAESREDACEPAAAPQPAETRQEASCADAENKENNGVYRIYTDGACLDNPGVCGAGFVALDGSGTPVEERSIPIGNGTNNVAELTAMIEALKFAIAECVPGRIGLISDSQYLIRGITQWSKRWIENDWKKSTGEPVQNLELWKELIALKERAEEMFELRFDWVKGHDGNYWNEVADSLASSAAEEAARQIA